MNEIVLKHDGLITISTGSSRKTKVWKPKQISWSKLVEKLRVTKRTNETQEQYEKLGKERQGEIKDVGGFVGGELENGRRTAMTVINRQLITLDADYAEKNLWEKATEKLEKAMCVYSTHKHKPEQPRLRIIMPLDRAVSPDEYEAISRKIAEKLGIENFDDTTYQAHRLMYYPSTSSDGEYYFKYYDEEFIKADEILSEYEDWQDVSTWARSNRAKEVVEREKKKAEDPLKKEGLIGAFCRAYTIQEVISAYLSDVYEEVNKERYTYKAGTSAGGAIVYEDKWLYSFHATDPSSLRLCNAFDLVRIHKYGEMDEGKEVKNITAMPSYIKMLETCAKDSKVKVLMQEEALQEFDDLGEEKSDMTWCGKLKVNAKTGKVLPNRYNIMLILENDAKLKERIAYDAFAQRIAITAPLYWQGKEDKAEYWTDGDDAQLRYFMETRYGIDNAKKIDDGVTIIANKRKFHKVREYLRGLKWDGKERLNNFFIEYLGAENNEYVKTVMRKSVIAAVGRVMEPGIKYDNMPVLTGAQGIGKSYLLYKMGKGWFSDSLRDLRNKDACEGLRGKWIIELGEMAFLKKTDNETAKSFISQQQDYFRESYGRRAQDYPRQCVFFGTTNERFYLKDRTGNRRFFPINCSYERRTKNVFLDKNLDEEIDQVWAEAKAAWDKGETLWIGYEMEQIAKKYQEQHMEENVLIGPIKEFLKKKVPADWYSRSIKRRVEYMRESGDFDEEVGEYIEREKISAAEIWCECLGSELKQYSAYKGKDITDALLSLEEWEISQTRQYFGVEYGLQRGFVRKKYEEDLPF